MAEQESSTPSQTQPLLRQRTTNGNGDNSPIRRSNLAMLISRASGRRGLREPSVLVRETAALQLEERRADWGYSRPVVALDITWNLIFALVSVVMLALTTKEKTTTPIRVWIVGYALQCVLHAILVWVEYRRRNRRRADGGSGGGGGGGATVDSDGNTSDDADGEGRGGQNGLGNRSNIAKRCESVNTMASFLWWIVGFYWVVAGGEDLYQNAPRLYWLSVVFLAFDVFFAIFCVALACVIGIALCCCLPCIIAILYAVAGQEGASDADLSVLPRYRFQTGSNGEKSIAGTGTMVPVATSSVDSANERILSSEDAECCICLSPYEDGAELHALPCNHNFHSACIIKWLHMNATCPLCKYNILKGNDQV